MGMGKGLRALRQHVATIAAADTVQEFRETAWSAQKHVRSSLNRHHNDETEPEKVGNTSWVSQAIERLPLPDSPASKPWEFALSTLIRPHLPAALRRLPGLLDRFGVIRFGPDTIALDSTHDIRWSDVVELRTQPFIDVFTSATIDNIGNTVARLLPISRLAKKPTQWLIDKTADAVLSLALITLTENSKRSAALQIPTEIIYRGRLGRQKKINPGLLSSAVLALPGVTESVLATARANDVPVTTSPMRSATHDQAELIPERAAKLMTRLKGLRHATAHEPVWDKTDSLTLPAGKDLDPQK
ncbi:MAG: hypothetical protein ACRDRN_02160 [Sciscionella sp.]